MTQIVLPLGLFLLMIGMGLSLTPDDFKRVLQARKPVLLGIGSMLILLPALGFFFASVFDLAPEIAVGIVLVATCPGGMFSNLMTDYAKGNLALSVTLTAAISTVYIFTIPLWAGLALSRFLGDATDIGLPFVQTLAPLLLFVLLPIGIGMVLRARAPEWSQRRTGVIKNVAAVIVIAIMVYIAAVQESETVENLPAILLAVVALNASSVALAALVAWAGRLDKPDAVALVIEHAVRQEGTGIYIAATLIGSATMALPLLLNSAVGMLVSLVVVLVSRRLRGAARPAGL